ncbi:hypothetical protein Pve01_42210 [Planomonospora venezuelensis]|nr:hypothetical protein Pve01_42210 [Planomonospora venezuelensis]
MTLLALTPVWVNPQRGQDGSTAGGFGAALPDAAGDGVADCGAGEAARSGAPPEEQLASASAVAMPAAEAITRPGRHHVDTLLPDDT